MYLDPSPRAQKLASEVSQFMDEHVFPNEALYYKQHAELKDRWDVPAIMDQLKGKAKEKGLWNLFLPQSEYGAGLTNLEYAPLAELMGRSFIASEVFNCSAPDTGNMEVLVRYGSPEQKEKWLKPLLNGQIRSCFAMTEPAVASSDATNIECSMVKDGDSFVVNGRKWWSSGAMDKRCKIAIVMGKTNPGGPKHKQQSMLLVPLDAKGVKIMRSLNVFGYDDAPHGHAEVLFEDVRVPESNLLLGEGRGFEIAQGRLGPGRIHHCMRSIGVAERALKLMIVRAIIEKGVVRQWIAQSRIEIDQARLLCLKAAHMMDTVGNKAARSEIAMIKVVGPNMALNVLDRAIQTHGAGGVSQDFFLAYAWAQLRTLRLADGPDEVHLESIAKFEIEKGSPKADKAEVKSESRAPELSPAAK
jgi:acyl-CoA dehydrogenase